MFPRVVVRVPSGRDQELVPGDLIGRVWSAALQLHDGRVSEAHAMVSLREGQLHLVALRGAFAVEGQPLPQVVLRPGMRVQLAQGLSIDVVAVDLPDVVLGIEGPGLPRQALPAVASVVLDPEPRLSRGWRADAALHLWSTGEGWMAQSPGSDPHPVDADTEVRLGDHTLRLVAIPLSAAGPSDTRRAGDLDAPLRVVANFDSVHVHRGDRVAASLSGKQARLVSELVAFGGPIAWGTLAAELWPEEPDPAVLRARLDVLLTRTRRALRSHGVRTDLVRTDGAGMVELFLYPRDAVEDRT